MLVRRLLATVAATAILVCGAERQGSWTASSDAGRTLAGTWTAEAGPDSAVTGTWELRDAAGKIRMAGGWSASKSPKGWNAFRLVVDPHFAVNAD